ncbi:hypothetical protein HYV69_03560 [Candidatus Uhrbacteria bacterium]|nr:hypothetical protein [Candidatus Uhrbacteria bacterium]
MQERVNATGGEGMPGIVQNFALFNRAGVLVNKDGFLTELEAFLVRYEKPEVAQKKSLGVNEYFVHVSYAPLPSFSELENEFGKGNVSRIFDDIEFRKHPSYLNIAEVSGGKVFLVQHFNKKVESEEAIAEMDNLGYRPATHIEAYAFQKEHPDLQRKFSILALGSFATSGGAQCVAELCGDSNRRIFNNNWFGYGWRADRRFLFIRK